MKKQFNKAYLYITPAIIGTLLFIVYPIIKTISLSFKSGSLLSSTFENVGLNNYTELLKNPEFIQTITNTAIYTFFMVTISISLAIVLAVWLNKNSIIHNLTQSIIFTPHVISLVSVAVLWLWIMEPQYGFLNWILSTLHLPTSKWLSSESSALMSLILIGIWKTLGYNILIVLSGLKSIPNYIYEASKLDNANKRTNFFKVTLPLLSPTIFFLMITTTTASFQVFDEISIMTQGGPVGSTNMLSYYIYESGFIYYDIGQASAASMFLLAIVMIATYANFRLLSKKVHYQ
ncbi:ABC transporter sugar-family permease [Clostridioides difficile]|uniref:carbohydrate ABC transporter permease n=2 Tax=Clostridioides difficile TaxID=1496 RepID=UPI000D1FC8EA|nr:sugar ABC transporter permease [Clostridioides difficile]UWD41171.1 sugar ABC transporter permease [Clostridioides difficile]UWD44954.1 sugar ABC transporter permease [Clostridioides difficile]VFF94328.1 ABC transporter sugar-family permease [Clostridioides difficile]VIG03068.1 ABC transporter sugar-family permease [Clostridioides difficile]HBE9437798.1 sugar ABC transporter permease [Clostridioides difficile]